MSASNDLENKILDHVLGGGDYSRLSTVYIALYTSDPGEGGSANTNEATGTSYARVSVTNNNTNFPAASSGVKTNGTDFEFPTPGSGGWGTVTHWAIVATSSSTGAILFSGALTVSKAINEGDEVVIPAGSLTITAN